jgi:hypothetical protein
MFAKIAVFVRQIRREWSSRKQNNEQTLQEYGSVEKE